MMHSMRYGLAIAIALLLALPAEALRAQGISPTSPAPLFNFGAQPLEKREVLPLEGTSEFYWGQLLSPNDFHRGRSSHPMLVDIPSSWTQYSMEGAHLPASGYATYRFSIIQPPQRGDRNYALRIPCILSSYNLWVNGQLLHSVGRVANHQHRAEGNPQAATIPLNSLSLRDTLEVIIQVSNFDYPTAGIEQSMLYGAYDAIVKADNRSNALAYVAIGSVLILCIWHAAIFLMNRRQKTSLSLMFVGIFFVVLLAAKFSPLLSEWFPRAAWHTHHRIACLSLLGIGIALLYGLRHAFPDEFSNRVARIPAAIALALAIAVLVIPPAFFANLRIIIFTLFIACSIMTCVWLLPLAIRHKRPMAVEILVGSIIFCIGFIMHVAFYNRPQLIGIPMAPIFIGLLIALLTVTAAHRLISGLRHAVKESRRHLQARNHLRAEMQSLQQEHEIQLANSQNLQQQQKVQMWGNTGVAKISAILAEFKNSLLPLCEHAIESIAKYLRANVGAIYIAQFNALQEAWDLHLTASYGFTEEQRRQNATFPNGEGLIGACFIDGTFQHITDLPDSFLRVHSGLGQHTPPSIIVMPLQADVGIIGVLALGRFGKFTEHEIAFVKRLSTILANSIMHARTNEDLLKNLASLREENQRLLAQIAANAQ